MRFYDFISDIRETSERIAERDAFLDPDVCAGLTIKTLMRPDVVAFFDALAGESVPSGPKALLYYTILYAYTVNGLPRPGKDDLVAFAAKLLKRLAAVGQPEDKDQILCATAAVKLPQRLVNRLSPVLKIRQHAGLFCQFSQRVPDKDLLRDLSADNFRDASLLLYPLGEAQTVTRSKLSDRLVYVGPIFASRHQGFGGVYIGANP